MDSDYIIKRLKLTPYKYYTVQLLRMRLSNLDKIHLDWLLLDLKMELYKHNNADIYDQLCEIIYRNPKAA